MASVSESYQGRDLYFQLINVYRNNLSISNKNHNTTFAAKRGFAAIVVFSFYSSVFSGTF